MEAAIKAGSDGTRQQRRLLGLSAFDRHQALIKDAIHYYRAKLPPEQQSVKTDYDVLKEQYRYSPTDTAPGAEPFGVFFSTACAAWCSFTQSASHFQLSCCDFATCIIYLADTTRYRSSPFSAASKLELNTACMLSKAVGVSHFEASCFDVLSFQVSAHCGG